MYKAFIADDEEIIRSGIAKFLEADQEIQLVATAEDGELALEAAQQYLPDILFVDINMPFLNGLEFIERLGGILRNAVIIIITGYDDFNYAQKALQLGVFDYLLKPLMEDTFYAALDRAKEKLLQTRRQVQYLEWARMQMEKNRATLIDEFLKDWLEDHYSETEAEERIQYLDLKLPERFAVTLLHLQEQEGWRDLEEEWNDDLLYYAVENISMESFEPYKPVWTFKNRHGDLVLISDCGAGELWEDLCHNLKATLERHLPVQAAWTRLDGVGQNNIPAVYRQVADQMRQNLNASPLVTEARHYIEQHFGEMDFSLQQAAAHLHVSPQHLSRVFRRETGTTFMDYLTRCRIRKAMELLAHDVKIYEIAERTGYSSQHYFSSAFKKVLSVSPLEYRRELLGK